VTPGFHSWPASLCLGCEPKARVATHWVLLTLFQTILHIDFLSINSHNTKVVHSTIIIHRLKSHIKDVLDIIKLDFMFPF
jgi:hypothetical protein